jgi:REP element-mobilizing transposase RayT
MKLHHRLPRLDLTNATYFASVRTEGFRAWFNRPERAELLSRLICAERGRSCLLHAFVVMPHHYHLLLTLLDDQRLPCIVQKINSLSARQVNAAVGREGRLWARRFYDHVVRNDDDFDECFAYIHDNPRAAGIVALATDYAFSSARFWEMRDSRWGGFDPLWG